MSHRADGRWSFWIDRGGTFTDLVARTPGGELRSAKLLSEDRRYEDAAIEGIRRFLDLEKDQEIPGDRIEAVRMGTTVATNALLERRGSPTVLVTSRGLGDVLRIGTQHRPDLFARQIVLPQPAYTHVVEAIERVGADGTVVVPLDRDLLRHDLAAARERGCRSAAIVFMHSWRFPDHELAAAELAREVGFEDLSVSHEVIPLMKIVGRGDTTVADAYVSPLLMRYVDHVRDKLGEDVPLYFMQSNGGLAAAREFRGRDSLLSGPAGGVVGMVEVSKRAGFDKVIGFDMGGTSTDVALFAGAFERTSSTEVGGVRIRVPMMSIHTVAAGGGSILKFEDGRFQVGPESAGADPGPACYRNDGPLTVTDAQVLLGRIRSEHFPRVFGPDGDQPIDVEVVRWRFDELTRSINDASGTSLTPFEVAEGFLRIAVERMATAIKEISIQKGHDVTEFILCSFGGAGGQHACRVADVLGIRTIILHPLAGVLSAYGIGVADLRAIRERTTECSLDADGESRLDELFDALVEDARDELRRQGTPDARIRIEKRINVRYAGTDSTIPVEWSGAVGSVEMFEREHEIRFGFLARDRSLVAESIEVEAIGRGDQPAFDRADQTDRQDEPLAFVNAVFDGSNRQVPLHERSGVGGAPVEGPAIIIEANSTTVVEPGWSAEVGPEGSLILRKSDGSETHDQIDPTVADPILLEVFNNLFMHIAEQMGAVLEHTAYSVNIKERLDFSCAVFDPDGYLVANAPHMPIHLGSMGESVRTIIRENAGAIRPGDVFMLNAPYNGGTHLPDVTVITPMFNDDESSIVFFVASRGHHADIGGITPGSMPALSQRVEEEGILFDNFRLVSEGELRENELRDLLGSGEFPARNPDQNVADIKAQVAANRKGILELARVIDHFGMTVVRAYMKHVQQNAEEAVRNVLDMLGDGHFELEMDNGSRIAASIRIDRDRRRATVDFTGTSPESEDNFNAPSAIARAAVLYVFRCLVERSIPMNEGCLAPIEIVIPDRSILSPQYPAAVVAGNVETSQCVTNALFGALGSLAAAQGTMNNFSFGSERHQYYETVCGGAGAGPGFEGASAVQTHMTNSRLTDPEVLEFRFPVRLEEFSIRRGSGGAGRWRGGDGVVRRIRFLEPMEGSILSGSRTIAPFGLEGGSPGAPGRNRVERADGTIEELGPTASVELQAGDLFVIETPGGGGYGRGES